MTTPTPDRRTAAPTPPHGVSRGQPLSWRNPWTLVLGAIAGFQAGVLVTMLATSGSDEPRPREPVATVTATPPPAPAEPVPPPAPAAPPPVVSEPAPPPPSEPEPGERRKRRRSPAAVPAPVEPPPASSPPSATGALVEVEVASEPEGATVRIAGAVWGVTPLTVYLPDTAPVAIRLELAGHAPARLTWSPTGRRALRAVLTPTESP